MTLNIFLNFIYLWLTLTSLVNGQYFPGAPRNFFPPQPQLSGRPFTQPYGPPNVFSPTGFNSNPQGTNPQNIPQISDRSFPSANSEMSQIVSELSTLLPQHLKFPLRQTNQPTTYTPQNPTPFNPRFTPQNPSFSYTNPQQQNNPIFHNVQSPSSTFNNPQRTGLFIPRPQQPNSFTPQQSRPFIPHQGIPYNPPETSSFNPLKNAPFNPPKTNPFTSDQTIPYKPPETNPFVPRQTIPYKPPETNPFIPRQTSPFTSDQTIPYKPPETNPFIPRQTIPYKPPETNPFIPRQTNPFHHQPTALLSTLPFQSSNPSNSRFQPMNPGPTAPQQASPNYARRQETVPTSYVPQKTSPDAANPQQTDSTGSKLTDSDTAGPEEINPDLIGSQETNSDTPGPEQANSDSTGSQEINPEIKSPQQTNSDLIDSQETNPDITAPQQTDSNPTSSQETDSDKTGLQQTDSDLVDSQPIPSASEVYTSLSNATQDTSSSATKPQASTHPAKNQSSNRHPYRRPRLDASGDPLRGRRIVCLFNNKHYYKSGFTPSRLDPVLCTHLNYEFAILDPKTYEMIVGEPELDIDMNFYEEAIHLKHFNPELKVLISLGGWSDSTKKYSELADDPAKRKNFIEKAIEFIQKHGFDGMDLAWEYPNCWEGAIGVSPKDKPNFVTLLSEIKEAFKPKGLIFSVSVGAIKREVDAAYDVPEVSKNVDYINVMTYDMHGPWEKKTSHHVQFEAMPGDADPYCNCKGGMQVWTENGASKKKLNMGLAFYGRTFRIADPNQCGMGVPAMGAGAAGPKSKEGGLLYYNEICDYLNSGNWTEKEEKHAGFYACSADQFAGYDPPPMMVRKAKYVAESGLGGVLIKDLGGDDFEGKCFNMPFPLLKMVRMELMRKMMHPHARRNH